MCRGELAAREQNTDDAISFYSKATIPQASYCQVRATLSFFLFLFILNVIVGSHLQETA